MNLIPVVPVAIQPAVYDTWCPETRTGNRAGDSAPPFMDMIKRYFSMDQISFGVSPWLKYQFLPAKITN
jgi:hypothetical protein